MTGDNNTSTQKRKGNNPNISGDSRTKRQKYGGRHMNNRQKLAASLKPGMRGVLLTHPRGRERDSAKEMLMILNEFADEMYGIFKREQSPANPVKEEIDSDHNDNDEEEYGDIEDSFKRELAEIKNTPRGGNRFRQVDLDVECLTFIQFLDLSVDPCTLTLKILKSIKSKNQGITRYTHRLLPVTTTCHTTIPSIIATATPLIDEHFKIEGKQEGIKYCVVSKIRNHVKVDRMELINSLAGVVGPSHPVDLEEPEKVILVEGIRSITCISIVTEFYVLKKFNLSPETSADSIQS